jgi:hypothetical protein
MTRFLALALLAAAAVRAETPICLSGLPLLFADDAGIASSEGTVRVVHPARRDPTPAIEPDCPWEGGRVYVYGSVYRDEDTQRFRLWYSSIGAVLFATSGDGLRWDKPALGIHASPGDVKTNNIVYHLHSPSVLVDLKERDPAKRYKMIGSRFFNDKKTGKVDRLRTGYYTATSPDGLHWRETSPAPAISNWWDTVTLAQDPRSGDYLAFHKRHWNHRGFNRRTVWLARSRDFLSWNEPEPVFAPDAEDDAWATLPGQRTEVYNMSVLPHAAGFIGLPTLFRVTAANRPDMKPNQSPDDGPIDVQLATSADGHVWSRTAPRTAVIANGPPGSFDAGCILGVSGTAVHVDDETWLYYTGINTTHGGPMPPKRIAVGRAVWRRHGFVSLDAADKGRIETKNLRLASPSLTVNADASRGSLHVGILEADGRPVPGLSAAESVPLQTDATRHAVRWTSGATPPAGRPVRVVLELDHARLFSLSSVLDNTTPQHNHTHTGDQP